MAKFKKGQTSPAVKEKKNKISSSIIRKSEILNNIENVEDIPPSLTQSASGLSQANIHKWSDPSIGVFSYSYNTARAEHNSQALKNLLKSIEEVNVRLKKSKSNKQTTAKQKPSNLSSESIQKIREENKHLKSALAEVYRAYMQLLDCCREDEQIDRAYRKLILDQARILGDNRLASIK